MLAELAVANAAFAVIKEAVQNSGDIMNAGQALFDYFDAESVIREKASKLDSTRSDLEEFVALEQLNAQQEELKNYMIYRGRPGMWQDWLAFKVKARQRRQEAEKARVRAEMVKRQKRLERLMNVVYTAIIFASLYVLYWMGELVWILTKGGK
jgi:hypothetical protein